MKISEWIVQLNLMREERGDIEFWIAYESEWAIITNAIPTEIKE